MAQAKARLSAKRSQGRKRSPAPKKTQAPHSRSATNRGSNGKARVVVARQAVESSTKEAGHAVSKAASNAAAREVGALSQHVAELATDANCCPGASP